jgi:hypothetical protein
MFLAHVSVNLGRLQAGVPQQLLDHSEIGAAVEQVGGKAVTEGVRMGGRKCPPVEHAAHVTGTEPTAPAVDKEGFGWRVSRDQIGPASGQPRLDGLGR